MLISSNTLPVDTQFTHLLVSGGRATAVRSKIKSRSGSHQRHRSFTSAFGGYFAGNLLASFKNKQDAVVLTTFKKDVEHERVRLKIRIPCSELSFQRLPYDMNCKARGSQQGNATFYQAGQPWDGFYLVGERQVVQLMSMSILGSLRVCCRQHECIYAVAQMHGIARTLRGCLETATL